MFKPVRIVATIVFLVMIGMIFVGAFAIKIDVSSAYYLPIVLATHCAIRLFYLVPVYQ